MFIFIDQCEDQATSAVRDLIDVTKELQETLGAVDTVQILTATISAVLASVPKVDRPDLVVSLIEEVL